MRRLISLALCTVAATPSFALTVSIWVEAPTVCIYATGSLQAQPSGGTAPYTFAWSNGSTEQGIIGLVAGTYSVTVTDAVSATATAEWTFTEDPLQAYVGAFKGVPVGSWVRSSACMGKEAPMP